MRMFPALGRRWHLLRAFFVALKDGVGVYGGFNGTELRLEDRDWIQNERVIHNTQVRAPFGATPATRIDGFTIRNLVEEASGAVHCHGASPVIANNRIVQNDTYGIWVSRGSPVITKNLIAANAEFFAQGGGGIFCEMGSPLIVKNPPLVLAKVQLIDGDLRLEWLGHAARLAVQTSTNQRMGGHISTFHNFRSMRARTRASAKVLRATKPPAHGGHISTFHNFRSMRARTRASAKVLRATKLKRLIAAAGE